MPSPEDPSSKHGGISSPPSSSSSDMSASSAYTVQKTRSDIVILSKKERIDVFIEQD